MVGVMLPIFLVNLGGDGAKVLEKIRSMEKEELQYMRELRAENSQKVERDEELKYTGVATSPVLHCFCSCSVSCAMSGTTPPVCTCSRGSRALWRRTPDMCATCVCAPGDQGWMAWCPCSYPSRRIPMVIMEGLALQCLVERAILWQKMARGFIVEGEAGLEMVMQQLNS